MQTLASAATTLPHEEAGSAQPYLTANRLSRRQDRIIIVGDPNAGKSTLTQWLRAAIQDQEWLIYVHVVTASADGEGQAVYQQKTYACDPNFAAALKNTNKAVTTTAFTRRIRQEIANGGDAPVMLIDIAGMPIRENLEIARLGTKAVILTASDQPENVVQKWREFCGEADVPVWAELRSDLGAVTDGPLDARAGVMYGSVAGLKRGAQGAGHSLVDQLARRQVAVTRRKYDWIGGRAEITDPFFKRLAQVRRDQEDRVFLLCGESIPAHRSAGGPLYRIRLGFTPKAPSAGGGRILDEALSDLRQIEPQMPEECTVLIDGAMSMPVAQMLALRLRRPTRTIAAYSRDVRSCIVVDAAQRGPAASSGLQVGDLLSRCSARPVGHLSNGPGMTDMRIELRDARDAANALSHSALLTVELKGECGSEAAIQTLASHAADLVDRTLYTPGDTLYFSGKVPPASARAAASLLGGRFARYAVFVPERKAYAVVSPGEPARSSRQLLKPPLEGSYTAECSVVDVGYTHDGALHTGALATIKPHPGHQGGSHHLVREIAAGLAAEPKWSDACAKPQALFISGQIPIAAAMAAAARAGGKSVGSFVPYHRGYIMADAGDGGGGKIISDVHPSEKICLDDAAIVQEVLGRRLPPDTPAARREALGRRLVRALTNARMISRTACGLYDRSSSPHKPPLLLAGYRLAEKAAKNLAEALFEADLHSTARFDSVPALRGVCEGLLLSAQRGILSDEYMHARGVRQRTWDLRYSRVSHLEVAARLDEFYQDLLADLDRRDHVAMRAALLHWRLEREIHPYADGVARFAQLVTTLYLARHAHALPQQRSRDEFYAAMEQGFGRFARYYAGLFAAEKEP